MSELREQLNIVIIGHVDHGKSTIIGRLLADTDSLPHGKLEAVKEYCEKNSRVFEYAYLLDALKEEQCQGVTIDTARCFFKTKKRNYLIIDAPGHFEFIKNMVTGASKADAAIIVIDAKEGIKENTKRHGYILSILGFKYAVVVVNKMDSVNYDKKRFEEIKDIYKEFLSNIGINSINFIPVSARDGENIVMKSSKMNWYNGNFLLDEIESWVIKDDEYEKSFRASVQDVYKFTSKDDERRILATTIDYGKISIGDKIKFFPSGKESEVNSIESFPNKLKNASAFESIGITIKDPFYISSGEIIAKVNENNYPFVSRRFIANIFWLETMHLALNKIYKIRLGHQVAKIKIVEIKNVIDATNPLNIQKKSYLDRFDIGNVIVESYKPLAFDIIRNFKKTSRFVIVDQHRIAGCALITETLEDKFVALEEDLNKRERLLRKGMVSREERERRNRHRGKFIILTGSSKNVLENIAITLEKRLFYDNNQVYFLSTETLSCGLDNDISVEYDRFEEIRRIGEIARIITDTGIIFISYITDLDKYELELLEMLNYPSEIVKIGIGVDEKDINNKLHLKIESEDIENIIEKIINYLRNCTILEYYI